MTAGIAIGDIGFTLLAFELWDFPTYILFVMSLLFGSLGVFLGHETGHAINVRAHGRAAIVTFCSFIYCGVLGTMRYNYMYVHGKDALFGNLVSSYGFIFVLVAASAILGNQLRYRSPAEMEAERQKKYDEQNELRRQRLEKKRADQNLAMERVKTLGAIKLAEEEAKRSLSADKAAAMAQQRLDKTAEKEQHRLDKDNIKQLHAVKRRNKLYNMIRIQTLSLTAKMQEEKKSTDALMHAYERGFRMLWRGHVLALTYSAIDIPSETSLMSGLSQSGSK
jgi:hypothetical protein